MKNIPETKLILASKSRSRLKILNSARLDVIAVASNLDENIFKNKMHNETAPVWAIAEKLAQEKALFISKEYQDHLVIGGDQILVCEGKCFDKAKSINEAKEHLKFFRGKPHHLVTSLALVKNNSVVWTHTELPTLYIRNFSEQFLDQYIKDANEALLHSVGCYYIEEGGIQLF